MGSDKIRSIIIEDLEIFRSRYWDKKMQEIVEQKKLDLINSEWFRYLIEEIKSIITETVFSSNVELLKGKWFVGQAVEKNLEKFTRSEIYGAKVNNIISKELDCSVTAVKYCRLFYKSYPDLNWSTALTDLPGDKTITWHKMVNQYLPRKTKSGNDPEAPCPHRQVEILIRCARCRERLGFRKQGRDSVVDLGKLTNLEEIK